MRRSAVGLMLVTSLGLGAHPAAAQNESRNVNVLPVGADAPDVTLEGATRYGVLRDHVRLSDYRGQVVVLAFFFRARTRG
jgi:hypothetical protein